jgi:hypothetical protein
LEYAKAIAELVLKLSIIEVVTEILAVTIHHLFAHTVRIEVSVSPLTKFTYIEKRLGGLVLDLSV